MDMEDEKKPFDAETAQDDDAQPDPDEHLIIMLGQGNGRVWLIPKFLMERWSAVNIEDVYLATLRVYNPPPDKPNEKARIPDCYGLDMVNESVENQIVVAERPKDLSLSVSTSARARTTILTGRIKHECNLRPAFSASYRRQMKERHKKYNTPMRQIQMISTADVPGDKGGINRLSSGVGVGARNAFGDSIKTKPKQAKVRLIDSVSFFSGRGRHCICKSPRWSFRPLRNKTQQPEVYLKEVLSEIAFLHKSGEHNGWWELQPEDAYKDSLVGVH
ncbi:transcription initiation factor IIF, beta subunit-domain-containing protein [Flammula alnicola]|nr:transcription initiation factor IIF, beta subunit-domain-containing protein [Flammula alnicola]